MRHIVLSAVLLALAGAARAQAPAVSPPIIRTMLQQVHLGGDRHATSVAHVVVAANGGGVPRHVHPGVEIGYVLEGSGDLKVDGQPTRTLRPGDSFQVAEGVAHSLANGDKPVTLLVVYVTEAGKPLSSPAP